MERGQGIARRDFLKGIAAAALTAGLIGPSEARAVMSGTKKVDLVLPQTLQPYPTIPISSGNASLNPGVREGLWKQVARTFVLDDSYIHMNTGTTGSQPLFSLINSGVYNLYKSMDPRDWQTNLKADFPDLFLSLAERQAAVAKQYGANADEIVLSYNTTDACNLIFAGTPWKSGDRIICTQWEHNALAGPIAWARDYFGVEVKIVDMPTNFTSGYTVDYVKSLFETELIKPLAPGGEKQYLAISEIFYKNGLRMPVKELCQLAQKYGAYTIIDSAHGWGQLAVKCHEYGADFIAGAGHKWLCGGPGTGILYIRKSSGTAPLPPFTGGNWAAYGNLFTVPSTRKNSRDWSPASLTSRGETNTPALYAMSDSAAYFGYLGVQNIYERGVALGNYFKGKVAAHWGPGALFVQRNETTDAFATALTAFNPFADKDTVGQFKGGQYSAMNAAINQVLATLAGENPKIYIRSISFRDKEGGATYPAADNRVAFRVSTHGVYNNEEQIDYMFERLVAAVNATGLKQLG